VCVYPQELLDRVPTAVNITKERFYKDLKIRHNRTNKNDYYFRKHGSTAYLIERNVKDYFNVGGRVSNYWAPLTNKYGSMVGAVAL
jgi:hypothetical protein